jgi:hypothetical protein
LFKKKKKFKEKEKSACLGFGFCQFVMINPYLRKYDDDIVTGV